MKKILIAEDEPVLRSLMQSTLSSEYEVHGAADGKEAWDMALTLKPDLVLLDLLMPIMTGYDVLANLRASEELKDTPCIVISNSGQSDDLNRAFDLGADDVLIKAEFNPDQLALKVAERLSSGRGVETLPAVEG